ncbi:Bug family tripartite tricarboxylate transporter substrate binding protein [Falsiroseomonas ponticola]|uniref:Bug family tripartite tricarboxylate transporter substrate binding protein n=1 Tax=Falsiroseomonas ponticola TaxID=2786951 RepID=UPI00193155A6|nr:tripartite tricarboxylate transporter substrate-binding protein [Roseomonas ponticola]
MMAASLPGAALAQGAARPVRILVPFPGGGTMDLVARLFAPTIGQLLGAPMVIDNRPGGGTVIATQEAARAAPDGTTLLMASNSFTINPFIQRNLPYDGERDFAPLAHVAVLPHMLVVHPSLGVRDLAGLVALSRSRPGGLSYASYGTGTSNHLSTELLKARTGGDFTHVPYRGSGQWLPDLLEGRVHMVLGILAEVVPPVREGRLTPIALAHGQRLAAAPGVPSFAELGMPDFASNSWFGFFTNAAVPEATRARLEAAVRAPLAEPAIRARFGELWIEPTGQGAGDFAAFLRGERAQYAEAVRLAGLQPQ